MEYLYLTKEALAGDEMWKNVISLPLPPYPDDALLFEARQAVLGYMEFVAAHYFVPDLQPEGVDEINKAAQKFIEICLAMAEAHKREFSDIPENEY